MTAEIPRVAALRARWLTDAGRLPEDPRSELTDELAREVRRLGGRWRYLRGAAFAQAEVPAWEDWKLAVYRSWQWKRYWNLAQRVWLLDPRYAEKRREAQREAIRRRDERRASDKEAERERQHSLYLKRKARRSA